MSGPILPLSISFHLTNPDRQCMYCKKKLSSQCERTNSNKTQSLMYGSNTAGIFCYSHFTGGFAGGQAEYVRVPYGSVNLLKLPDSVPDEKGEFCCKIRSEIQEINQEIKVYIFPMCWQPPGIVW